MSGQEAQATSLAGGSDDTASSGATPASADASRRVARAALLVMAFYLLSRVTGLLREAVIAAQFGVGADLDAYLAAFRIPDLLFQLIAGGALGSAFIPVFSSKWARGERQGAWLLFSRVLNLLTGVLVAAAALAALFALPLVERFIAPGFTPQQQEETAALMRLMLMSTVVFGVSGLAMAALNAVQHFLWPAAAPTLYNLAIMGGALLLGPRMGVYGLAIGVVVGAWGHLLVQLPSLRRYGASYTLSWSLRDVGVREVLWLMTPRVLGLLFVQMHFLVNTILASGLDAGSLSALNYAWLVMLLPLGIFAQSLATAAFPTFAAQAAAGESAQMRRTFGQALRTVLFIEVPAAVGLFIFGGALIGVLFERGAFTSEMTLLVAYALRFYAIGLAGHAALEIVVRAFYALHDTWTPVFVGMATMILAIGLSIWWVGVLGFGGLALASSIAVLLETALLLALLRPRMGGIEGKELAVSLARTSVAAACMGVVLWLFCERLPQLTGAAPLWALVVIGAGSAALVYAVVAWMLRSPELRWAAAPLLRRVRRQP